MNVFYLHRNPKGAAAFLCDKHLIKMITESCQLLSTTYHILDDIHKSDVYKPVHINHPSAKWTRYSSLTFAWLLEHTDYMIQEYDFRFDKKNKFQTARQVIQVCKNSPPKFSRNEFVPPFFAFGKPSNPPLHLKYNSLKPQFGFYDEKEKVWRCESKDQSVEAYRTYYKLKVFENDVLPSWNKNPYGVPPWYVHTDLCIINRQGIPL